MHYDPTEAEGLRLKVRRPMRRNRKSEASSGCEVGESIRGETQASVAGCSIKAWALGPGSLLVW